jgi:hypothetical protein
MVCHVKAGSKIPLLMRDSNSEMKMTRVDNPELACEAHSLCGGVYGSTSQGCDRKFRTCRSFPFNKVDSWRIPHGCQPAPFLPAPVSTFISFCIMRHATAATSH